MAVAGSVKRGEVYLIDLEPARGGEIRKTRPCAVMSPDEMNASLSTFIVAPLTTGGHPYPFRLPCRFHGKSGFLVLDQLRTVDRARLVRRLGQIGPAVLGNALLSLQEMFAPG